MNLISWALLAVVAVHFCGCAPSPQKTHHLDTAQSVEISVADTAGLTFARAPENILAKAQVAFGKLKSFRVRETMDPVGGSHATYEIEVLALDLEHVISHGDCPNKKAGETIRIGAVRYSRCDRARWTQRQETGNGTLGMYKDLLENTHAFALARLETEQLWQIRSDYRGGLVPQGTMTWLIGEEDLLPRKLTFIAESGYMLVSEFRDFDDPSIIIALPTAE